jgi:hypothetical protein
MDILSDMSGWQVVRQLSIRNMRNPSLRPATSLFRDAEMDMDRTGGVADDWIAWRVFIFGDDRQRSLLGMSCERGVSQGREVGPGK